jgi:tubulin polyglutamylase TTLL6/13
LIKADNSHEIVEEKLEKIRQEREEAEAKKRGQTDEGDEEPKKKKNTQKLILCTFQTKYRVVKKSCRKLDYKLCEDQNLDWDLYWADTGLQPQIVQKMQSYQRINHYPGMASLAHKHNLSRNLKRMQKVFNKEYEFFPKTWILPSDQSDFKQ